jgi:RTX calcium-binding nonapeptide repeat (4 copies)
VVHIDVAHGKLDIAFLIEAAAILGLPVPIDLNAIGDQLEKSPFIFQRYMGTDQLGWYEYLPVLPQSAAIAPYFQRYLPQWYNDMDGQNFLPGYAEIAKLTAVGASPISITLTNLDDGRVMARNFMSAQEVIDYWYSIAAQQNVPMVPHVNGTSLRDVMSGTSEVDYILGMSGDDEISGGDGNDWLFGEVGNDTLYGQIGDDKLSGNDGADQLYGGSGHDDLRGQAGDDQLFGNEGQDTLAGGAGLDLLFGGDDNDRLLGNADNDTLNGDDGNDVLLGGAGRDLLIGGAGHDYVQGGADADTLTGGANNDWFIFSKPAENTGDIITDYAIGDTLYFGQSTTAPTFMIAGPDLKVNGITLTAATFSNVIAIVQSSLGLAGSGEDAQYSNIVKDGYTALSVYGAYDRFEFDADVNEDWFIRKQSYNSDGALTSFVENKDSGETQTIIYDTLNADWAFERTDRTVSNLVSFKQTYKDDNSRTNTVFDVGNLGQLNYSIDEFNGPGVLQVRTDVYDNGNIGTTNYTLAGQAWYKRDINLDGSRAQTSYDIASENWFAIRTFTDPTNRVTREEQFNDDNTRVYLHYDYNGSDWYQIQTTYDNNGRVDFERVQYDAGNFTITDFDQNNQFATWTYHVKEYSLVGELTQDFFVV